MTSHIGKDRCQRSYSKSAVAGDRYVVLALLHGRQAQMAAGLTGDAVTDNPKRVGEVIPREIPGESHTAMVSSLTK